MGYTVANALLHVVVPVLALSDWLLVGRGWGRVHWWHPLAWLVYPALYVVIALAILNGAARRTPYFFLDPGSVRGHGDAQHMCAGRVRARRRLRVAGSQPARDTGSDRRRLKRSERRIRSSVVTVSRGVVDMRWRMGIAATC